MRTLVAEDDPVGRTLVETFLAKWGYDVLMTMDGEEAWAALQQENPPRLAILDWMMPGMEGVQICREIRKQTERPYVYIVLLTARSQKQDLLAGLEAGADDYLTKPFDPEELKLRLRAGRRILDLREDLFAMQEAMQYPASHDLLTGLGNREAILGTLRQKLAQERELAPVAIILANIDRFKHIIDSYGTPAGDTVLREVARRLRSVAGSRGSIGRTRTGEFLVVVSGCYPAEIFKEAEELRASISAHPIDILGTAVDVTISVGVATTDEVQSADSLLVAADSAVRRAKARGRNLVELATIADASPAKIW